MELRHLRYFVAVAEELNFRRAAERLYVAQPAVSAQVRKLEEELGVRLLERTQRNVSLTGAGATLLIEARRVLHGAEIARAAVRNARDGAIAHLRIGYMPASLPAHVPRALRRLGRELANLAPSLEPGDGLELIEAVRGEQLDAAVISLPAPTAGLRVTRIGEEHAVAAMPVDHRQAVSSVIRLEQMSPERIMVLPRDANRPFYDAIVSACSDAGLSPTFIEMADGHAEPPLLAVACGLGMALIPWSVAERHVARGVRFIPLDGPQPAVAMAVVTRRSSTHLPTAAFLRAVSQGDQPCEPCSAAPPMSTAA